MAPIGRQTKLPCAVLVGSVVLAFLLSGCGGQGQPRRIGNGAYVLFPAVFVGCLADEVGKRALGGDPNVHRAVTRSVDIVEGVANWPGGARPADACQRCPEPAGE